MHFYYVLGQNVMFRLKALLFFANCHACFLTFLPLAMRFLFSIQPTHFLPPHHYVYKTTETIGGGICCIEIYLDETMTFFFVFFVVACFTCTPDSIQLVNWGTWHRCQRWGSIVEWRNLVTSEKLHWSQVGLEPRSLQIAWPLLQAR